MGLELRHGTICYYRKERHGQHVVSRYVASGRQALELAAQDERRRAEAGIRSARWQYARSRDRLAELELIAFAQAVELVAEFCLEAAGYHRPNRGPWRRRRGVQAAAELTPPRGSIDERLLVVQFSATDSTMIQETKHGPAPERLDALGAAFDAARRAGWPELFVVGVTTGAIVRAGIARTLAGAGNRAAFAAIMAEAEAVRDQAAGAHPTPLEGLLAERVAACWLDVRRCERLIRRGRLIRDDERRVRRAGRRLQHAVKALEQVRRLNVAFPPAAPVSTI